MHLISIPSILISEFNHISNLRRCLVVNINICNLLEIKHSLMVFHPQTNSLNESANQNVKRALDVLVKERANDWDIYLPQTLFSLRSQEHPSNCHCKLGCKNAWEDEQNGALQANGQQLQWAQTANAYANVSAGSTS
ncbi:hypothetical protein AAFF_G00000080 [Aldrovandia affinis]|uniref:Integrase catalytic domain-containing protein n=1 Tax=Aldrovandia affinis TaxID=143900 RepID=A0AAD7TCP5_9TELE|nr:hypothetical protein AAFF_G00000080 [Aldrovandia affinis]